MNKKKMTIIIVLVILVACMAIAFLVSGQEKTHEYYCDKFMLTVDEKQYDLSELVPDLSSVSALQQITNRHLFILGRVDEHNNMLLVYDFKKDEFIFNEKGMTMCWIQDDFDSVRYLKENTVYDLEGTVIYQPDEDCAISMIEYVDKDFCVTVVDSERENPQQIWVD